MRADPAAKVPPVVVREAVDNARPAGLHKAVKGDNAEPRGLQTSAPTLTTRGPIKHAKPRVKSVDQNAIDYRRKLARVAADLRSGEIDRLTLVIGRERYQMRDTRTHKMQRDLVKQGLLEQRGRRYVSAVRPGLRLAA